MTITYLDFSCGTDGLVIDPAQTAAYVANRCDICDDSIKTSIDIRNDCDVLGFELSGDGTSVLTKTPPVSPISDPAPWYDATQPESAGFMGFMVSEVRKPSHISRAITPRLSGSGGGILETLRPGAQVYEIELFMFACDDASMEYGMRYLSNSVIGGGCDEDPCELCDVTFRESCPSYTGTPTVDEFNTGLWVLHNVAIVQSPEWVDGPVQGAGHYVRRARFTFASELPWRFKAPTVCTEDEAFTITTPTLGCGADFDSLFCAPTAVSCAVSAPDIVGELALIITIEAGDTLPLSGIEIQIIEDEFGYVCDPGSAPGGWIDPDPVELIYIKNIPAEHNLVYDTAVEKVQIQNGDTSTFVDATSYLTFDGLGGPPVFPKLKCGDYCVKVIADECSVSANTLVTIETAYREF